MDIYAVFLLISITNAQFFFGNGYFPSVGRVELSVRMPTQNRDSTSPPNQNQSHCQCDCENITSRAEPFTLTDIGQSAKDIGKSATDIASGVFHKIPEHFQNRFYGLFQEGKNKLAGQPFQSVSHVCQYRYIYKLR